MLTPYRPESWTHLGAVGSRAEAIVEAVRILPLNVFKQ